MKNKIYSLLFLSLICGLFSCNNKKKQLEHKDFESNLSYRVIGKELFKNVDFYYWNTNAKPKYWDINENMQNAEEYVVDRDTLDLLLNGNEKELTYISQKVNVKQNTFYLIEADIETNLKYNSKSCISVNSKNRLLSKRVFKKKTRQKYTAIFNSKNEEYINCYIGYVEKEKGQIKIKSLSLKEVHLNINVYQSEISQYFFNNLKLDFDNEYAFDNSVELIFRNIGELLVSRKRKDTVNMKKAIYLNNILKSQSYLKKYLNESVGNTLKSFDTKLVFSGIEILTEFNIGTQRIELYKNKQRNHVLLKYYNSFSEKWITIDPFYNVKINSINNPKDININNVDILNYGGLSNSIEGLLRRFSQARIVIKQEKIISYPF
tara:strand:- start:3534 stop:4664 length:1131 start_codon:yes stop_codon:yes gene_type:complete